MPLPMRANKSVENGVMRATMYDQSNNVVSPSRLQQDDHRLMGPHRGKKASTARA